MSVSNDWTFSGGYLGIIGTLNMGGNALTLSGSSTLAMGHDFNAATITAPINASAIYGLDNATFEVTNGATGTQDQYGEFDLAALRVGSTKGVGTYNLSNGTLSVTNLRIGADGGLGTFNWTGGDINAAAIYVGSQGVFSIGQDWTWTGNLLVSGTVNMNGNALTLNGGSTLGLGINFNLSSIGSYRAAYPRATKCRRYWKNGRACHEKAWCKCDCDCRARVGERRQRKHHRLVGER